jgi:peptidoglycan/LPS O-acetylase OafA/YrhL
LADPIPFLQAMFLLQDYRPSTLLDGIGPAWSLAVEVVFYCALPLLVLSAAWAARFAKDRGGRVLVLLGPPLLLLLVGLSGKFVAARVLPGSPTAGYSTNWHSVVERSFWAQADLFSFGMIVAVIYAQVADGRLAMTSVWRRLSVALGLLVFVPSAWTMHQGEHSYLLQNTGEALGISLLFAAVVLPEPARTRPLAIVRLLETRALVSVGIVSYSLFLWHLPLIQWLQVHGLTAGGRWGLLLDLAVVFGIAGALSSLTYRYVEAPALRRKRSTRAPAAPAQTVPEAGEPATLPAAVPAAG